MARLSVTGRPATLVAVDRDGGRGQQVEALRRLLLHQDGLALNAAIATLDRVGGRLVGRRRGGLPLGALVAPSTSEVTIAACVRATVAAGWLAVDDRWPSAATVVSSTPRGESLTPVWEAHVELHRQMRVALEGAAWSQPSDVVERAASLADQLATARRAVDRVHGLTREERHVAALQLEGPLASTALPRLASAPQDSSTPGAVARLLGTLGLTDGQVKTLRQLYGYGSYARSLMELTSWVVGEERIAPSMVGAYVDRALNVTASAAAHRGYFKAAQVVVGAVFDREPLASQPRAIVDVGCGSGAWLAALEDFVRTRTRRGRALRQHPLALVGVDADPHALAVAERTLADRSALLVEGDVADPAGIASRLRETAGLEPDDVLHVRAFVDHNRVLRDALAEAGMVTGVPAVSEGMVYQNAAGERLTADTVLADWVTHLSSWRDVCERHGFVVLEAHPLEAGDSLAARGNTNSLAFELTHSLSGQSPLTWATFNRAVTAAGLVRAAPAITYRRGAPPTVSVQHVVPATGVGSRSFE